MDIEPRRRFVARSLSLVALVLAVATPARGQSPSPEDIASARSLGTEGVRLAEAGDCASAIPKLEAAEQLYHAPTTLERLGECHINLGHLVAGTEAMNRVVRETLPPGAPTAFVTARQRAAQLLATTQPRIGKLRIHVDGAPLDKVTVTVDGANVPSALFDAERATDPGTHEVKAAAAGFKPASTSVRVTAGTGSTVSLSLEVDPNAQPEWAASSAWVATEPPMPIAPGPAPGPAAPSHLPAFVALGIGGVGIAIGSVFGIMALGTKSTLDNACPNKKMCPSSSQTDIDELSARSTVSSIGFGVGIAALAVGTVLLVTSHASETRPATASLSPHRIEVRPWLGAGGLGLGGIFE